VDGISVRLDKSYTVTVKNNGGNNISIPPNQQAGELEVDGVWYSWSTPTNGFDVPSAAAGTASPQFTISLGGQWRAEAQGVSKTVGLGAPLNLAPGTHKIRFAVMAHRNSSATGPDVTPQFRVVSNPVEIEVFEDTFLSRRPPRTGGAANPAPAPAPARP
jgi:hypothetical protein